MTSAIESAGEPNGCTCCQQFGRLEMARKFVRLNWWAEDFPRHKHTHTAALHHSIDFFSLTNIHTRWLAGWLGSHTTHTLHTSRANTHGSSNAQTILSNLSPSHLPSFLPMRARHQFPSGGGKRVFGWGPRWLSRPPLDVTTRQRLCRANNKTTAETLRVEFSVQRI
jgi:hypothetical protein